jgi:hypothetical protein
VKERLIYQEIEYLAKELNHKMMENWKTHFVFSPSWWFLMTLTIIPWLLWWRFVDKKRLTEILLFGSFISLTSTFLDVIGWNYSLWIYPNTLLALCTPLVPIDYTLLPIGYMIIYQHCSKWKSFLTCIIIMAAFFAFVLEPLSEWLNIYKALKWKHSYSFISYIMIGISLKWLVKTLVNIQKSYPVK